MKNNFKILAVIGLGLFCSLRAMAGDESLEGIYRQHIDITKDGMMFEKGDKMMSEMIIMKDSSGKYTVNMNLGHPSGVVCSMENGEVLDVSKRSFKVRAVDDLFGDVCQLTMTNTNDSVTIKDEESNCAEFCGYGASFKGAKLRKVCITPTQTSVDHLLDMFYMSEDNILACE